MYDYNIWANHKTLDSLEPLKNEQFTAPMGGSFASIRDTVVHIIGAEWIWWQRCIGERPKGLLDPAEFPDVAACRGRWREIDDGYLSLVKNANLDENVTYINRHGNQYTYSIGKILLHNVNHSSYHRGQVVTLLRQIEAKPAVTDYLVFIDERSPR
ncbi:MAG TPA: DinB family protein [Thermoanaerobaculia bacterium]|nr:DinB family protein [Thermoanaerobaculia bacterium]